jgi:hypothetical protein
LIDFLETILSGLDVQQKVREEFTQERLAEMAAEFKLADRTGAALLPDSLSEGLAGQKVWRGGSRRLSSSLRQAEKSPFNGYGSIGNNWADVLIRSRSIFSEVSLHLSDPSASAGKF